MQHPRPTPNAGAPSLPISPALAPTLEHEHLVAPAADTSPVTRRVATLSAIAIALAMAAACVAQLLVRLIALATHIAFFGEFSFDVASANPSHNALGAWVVLVPICGGIIVGLMARYGSKAIRGHGIPEAMEQVLINESRIPPRMTFLKPLSAAIAIGTGGPFGAEGPIIATGGALGSLVGQLLHTTAAERKTLLAAGAAAGMAATFGAPVSAVLLAIELLLFEFRPRSLIPVALAASTAAGVRTLFDGSAPVFPLANLDPPSGLSLALYVVIGAVIGVAAVGVTRAVYAIEDSFEHLPLHWMWWPALGAIAVGACGYIAPRTLGVGYYNITEILGGALPLSFVIWLCALKFVSWSIALGSGTSGGTLAPLFTIGGGLGMLLGSAAQWAIPSAGIDLRIAALVGMAGLFAGASRALLASVVFAFETTLQPLGLLPLLGGCSAAFLVSSLLMRNTIMTEKIARRGVRVPADYHADVLDRVAVREVMTPNVITIAADRTIAGVRGWIAAGGAGASHQGFPVIDPSTGAIRGVLTRRDLFDPAAGDDLPAEALIKTPPRVVYEDCTLREAIDHMVNHDIGRLPVVRRASPVGVIGILTRSDVLRAHRLRLREEGHAHRSIQWRGARAAARAS